MNPIWLCTSALILTCVFGFGTTLECYSCQIIEGITLENPCKAPIKCAGPSVCLSVSFSLESVLENKKLSATVKSCIPKSASEHCKTISDLDKTVQFPGFKTNFGGDCYTCDKDGCNRGSGSTKGSLLLFLTLSMASLFWCIVTRS